MPNWTDNTIIVTGKSRSMINQCLEAIAGDNGCIDFNKIIPMPEAIKNLHTGFITIDGEKVTVWRENDGVARKLTEDEFTAIKATGHESWYDWSIAHWGTKWNACEAELEGNVITFQTAWSAPKPIIHKLRLDWPKLVFQVTCMDEDGEKEYQV